MDKAFEKLKAEIDSIVKKVFKELKFFLPISMNYDLERGSGGDCAAVLLRDAKHPDLYFYLKQEIPIKNLCELGAILREINNEAFFHHVKNGKNDFSMWVREIIGDRILADKLDRLRTREDYAKAVNIRVEYMKSKLEQKY